MLQKFFYFIAFQFLQKNIKIKFDSKDFTDRKSQGSSNGLDLSNSMRSSSVINELNKSLGRTIILEAFKE